MKNKICNYCGKEIDEEDIAYKKTKTYHSECIEKEKYNPKIQKRMSWLNKFIQK